MPLGEWPTLLDASMEGAYRSPPKARKKAQPVEPRVDVCHYYYEEDYDHEKPEPPARDIDIHQLSSVCCGGPLWSDSPFSMVGKSKPCVYCARSDANLNFCAWRACECE